MTKVKIRKSAVFGEAFLGKKAYKEVKLPDGYAPPSEGNEKPFNYELWNTLRKMGRVGKNAKN